MDSNLNSPLTNIYVRESLSSKQPYRTAGEASPAKQLQPEEKGKFIDSACDIAQSDETPHFNRLINAQLPISVDTLKQRLHREDIGVPKQFPIEQEESQAEDWFQRSHSDSGDEQASQFQELKKNMGEVEFIANTQIRLLKQELFKAQQRNKQLELMAKPATREVGVNTEEDSREEEVAALKEALIRHVRVNKHLLSEQYHQNRQNMRGSAMRKGDTLK